MASELAHRRHISDFFGVSVQSKVLGDLPHKDLAVFGTGSNDTVVEGVPAQNVSSAPLTPRSSARTKREKEEEKEASSQTSQCPKQ